MIRSLILLLVLSAPSFAAQKVYGNFDPCIIVGDKKTCSASATPEQIAAWDHYWMEEPYFGEDEQEALARYKAAHFADLGTTGAGLLLCTAVVESNPVGILIPAGKYLHYKYVEGQAKKTPRVYSMADGINMSAAVTGGAAAWNIGILSKCL